MSDFVSEKLLSSSLPKTQHFQVPEETPLEDVITTIRKTMGEYIFDEEIEELFLCMQTHYQSLKAQCVTPEDILLLDQLFRKISFGKTQMIVPHEKAKLRVCEMMRLLDLGLHLGGWDSELKIKNNGRQRFPMYLGKPLPKADWDKFFSCMLHYHSYVQMYNDYETLMGNLLQVVRHFHPVHFAKAHPEVYQLLEKQIEKLMYGYEVPKPRLLRKPPLLSLDCSILREEEGKSLVSHLTTIGKFALKQQSLKSVPSLFEKSSYELLSKVPFELCLLLDTSESLAYQQVYKVAEVACVSLAKTLQQMLPQAKIILLPYHYSFARPKPIPPEKLRHFLHPSGPTYYDSAFLTATDLLKDSSHYRFVLHLTDGLPNHLENTLRYASLFPKLGIQYSHVIFGHNFQTLTRELLVTELQKLGASQEVTNLERYIESCTKIATAAHGNQVMLWIAERLGETLLALVDLALGTYFLLEEYTMEDFEGGTVFPTKTTSVMN